MLLLAVLNLVLIAIYEFVVWKAGTASAFLITSCFTTAFAINYLRNQRSVGQTVGVTLLLLLVIVATCVGFVTAETGNIRAVALIIIGGTAGLFLSYPLFEQPQRFIHLLGVLATAANILPLVSRSLF